MSHPRHRIRAMATGDELSAAEANEAIRRFVSGRILWPPEALEELARLRRIYLAAVARELDVAA